MVRGILEHCGREGQDRREERGRGALMSLSSAARAVKAGLVVAAFLFVFVFTVPRGGWAVGRTVNPHDWSNKETCLSCHESTMPALKFDTVTVCSRCHEGHVVNHPVVKHPLGKRPGINISKRMPLDAHGKLVCYTCHDTHNRLNYPNMLRIGYLQLCSSCHRGY